MSERQLYRLVAGKQTGPYPPEKLRPLVADGRISRLDRFSYDGVDWLSADQIPELKGRPAAATPATASVEPPTAPVFPAAMETPGTAPPPPPRSSGAVTQSLNPGRRNRLPLFAAIGGVLATLLVAGAFLGFRGSPLSAGGLADVTDRFDTVVKSPQAFDGKSVCVRGTYFPQELSPRASGRDYTIKFRSSGTKRAVVSGDRQDRLTIVVPQAMGSRLMQIVGRLESEQPAMLELACTQTDTGGEERPIGRVTKITFCRETPTLTGSKAFLQMDEDGEIEED
jgi:hypothetical protein